MPQYLVANYLPDDFDPSVVTEAMMEEIHAQPRNDCCRREEVRLRYFGWQREDAAGPARRQGARHRRAVPRPRSTWADFDTGMR